MFEIISWLVSVLVFSLIHIKMPRKRKQRENEKLKIKGKQKILSLVDKLKQNDAKISSRKLSEKVSPVTSGQSLRRKLVN